MSIEIDKDGILLMVRFLKHRVFVIETTPDPLRCKGYTENKFANGNVVRRWNVRDKFVIGWDTE